MLGSLNSIKLSMEVIKSTQDRDELLMLVGFVNNEVGKIVKMVDQVSTAPRASGRDESGG